MHSLTQETGGYGLRKSDEFPKGMAPPAPKKAPEPPAPLTLADSNYVGAIRLVILARKAVEAGERNSSLEDVHGPGS